MLAIRQIGGESAIYPVSEIDRVVFAGDTLLVEESSGSATYPLASIEQVEFLWGFSDVETPNDLAGCLKLTRLFQNRPNPFSPSTRIGFELARAGRVQLAVYSVDGRLVRTLLDDECPIGAQVVSWDGCDAAGRKVAGGVYFCKLAAPGISDMRRMILVP